MNDPQETPAIGSLFQIEWCDDGTSLAAAGGNGSVCFASIMGQATTWESLEVSLSPQLNTLIVRDLVNETVEELDHRDRVINFSIDFGYLIAVTTSQLSIYSTSADKVLSSTPQMEDLKEPPTLILQSPSRFALVDSSGLGIYTYEGRQLSTVRYSGMRVEFMNAQTVSLSDDLIAVVDVGTSGTGRSGFLGLFSLKDTDIGL